MEAFTLLINDTKGQLLFHYHPVTETACELLIPWCSMLMQQTTEKFLMQFEINLVAKGKDSKPDKLKVNLLLNCAGPEAIEEYSHFVYNEGEDKECFADVCSKLKEMCEGGRNVIYERLVFNQRNQKEGVFDMSREVGLKFKPKNVKLRVPEVSYVGHFSPLKPQTRL